MVLSLASVGFALAGGPLGLGVARFAQGVSSATTWAGALAWVAVSVERERRGQALGTVFGLAVFGFVVGPMFGAVADLAGIRGSFVAVALVAAGLAAGLALVEAPAREEARAGAIGRALRDRAFVGGLWLNTLPALFFGTLDVLVPLLFDDAGYGALAIAAVFVVAGAVEVVVNPVVGRISDRRGRLLPVRVPLPRRSSSPRGSRSRRSRLPSRRSSSPRPSRSAASTRRGCRSSPTGRSARASRRVSDSA